MLLFIDEADAFLSSRARKDMTEDMRNALTALLYQTGEQSHRFVMVLATNRPNDLDTASGNMEASRTPLSDSILLTTASFWGISCFFFFFFHRP